MGQRLIEIPRRMEILMVYDEEKQDLIKVIVRNEQLEKIVDLINS